jgi:hypothetical protein
MYLRNVKSFNHTYDIEVKRIKNNLSIKVFNRNHIFLETMINNGEKIDIKMTNPVKSN